MNYVESFNFYGVDAKEIPCIKGSGAPTSSTAGAVGCFYMDTKTGNVYKCVTAASGVYTWKDMVDTQEIVDMVVAAIPAAEGVSY